MDPDLDVVGDWQIHEQTFIIDKRAPGHLLQTANRAIGQVGVGGEDALLDHIKRTIVRLLSAQQLTLFQPLELSVFPNF